MSVIIFSMQACKTKESVPGYDSSAFIGKQAHIKT